MATLARSAEQDGMEVVLVTSDKDLQQLVRPGVRVLSPRGRQGDEDLWLDEAEVEAKWGVPPSSLRDLLALMGDSVDNVPGVPGIGEKTAAALIGRFGNLETLYARLDEVERESLKKKLAEHREAAFFSRKLVTVQDDLDLAFEWERLTVRPPDADRLQALGERYDLRRLLTWAEQVRSGSPAMAGAGGAMAGAAVPWRGPGEAKENGRSGIRHPSRDGFCRGKSSACPRSQQGSRSIQLALREPRRSGPAAVWAAGAGDRRGARARGAGA
jgi:DNA polymerase-1